MQFDRLANNFSMSSNDAVLLIVLVCSVASLVLSVWNGFQRQAFFDRICPLILQAFTFASLLSWNHGFPRELFGPMIMTFGLFLLASVSGYRLYGRKNQASSVLGISQFIQWLGFSWLTMLVYVGACYTCYGHLVGNP